MKLAKVPLSTLVLDYNFYPRGKVDLQHASYIAEALRAGSDVPPIIIDKESRRVIDGFHRYAAHRRLASPETDPEIEVELRSYASEVDMLRDAARLNATHGRALSAWDRQRVIRLAERFKLTDNQLAADLAVTEAKIIELRSGMARKHFSASPPPDDDGADEDRVVGPSRIELKRMIRHMRDRELNARQIEAQEHLIGIEQSALVGQLLLLIENGLIDTENPRMMEALRRLRDALNAMKALDEAAA